MSSLTSSPMYPYFFVYLWISEKVIFVHQNLISNRLTYLVHANSTGELISFGFSDRSVRSLVSAKRSANHWDQTKKRLHFLAYLWSQSELWTHRKSQWETDPKREITHCVSTKVSHLMFDNNFGKCGRFSKFFHRVIRKKILYVYITKISTSPTICCNTNSWKSKIQNVTDFDSPSRDCWHVPEDTLRTWFNM